MKAQITLQYLFVFLILLTTLTLLTGAVLFYSQNTNSLNSISNQKSTLLFPSLNFGFLYIHTNHLSHPQNISSISLILNSNLIISNDSSTYTLNPSKGATYAQKNNFIPN